MTEFILEIGCEELPSWAQEIINTFENVFVTPRRIIFHTKDIDEINEILKNPSKFLEDFLLELKILILKKLNQHKLDIGSLFMRWGTSEFEMIRPIRWLLCLYNDQEIKLNKFVEKFKIELLTDNFKTTFGHRLICKNEKIFIHSAENFFRILKEKYIICDLTERIQTIIENISHKIDDEVFHLVEQNACLTEYPQIIKIEIPEKYTATIPKIFIRDILAKHQRCICVEDGEKYFAIAIIDNIPNHNIITGWQRVIIARLEDALFFWKQDLISNIENLKAKLKTKIFINNFGTLEDKKNRALFIVQALYALNYLDVRENNVLSAFYEYNKIDLSSNMVSEYPEFQGKIGAFLFERKNIEKFTNETNFIIFKLIFSQYDLEELFQNLKYDLTYCFYIKIIDFLDLFGACIINNNVPTSSSDPLGLRKDCRIFIKLFEQDYILIRKIFKTFTEIKEIFIKEFLPNQNFDEINQTINDFIKKRIQSFIKENYAQDVYKDLINDNLENLINSKQELDAEQKIFNSNSKIFKKYKNTKNRILKYLNENNFEENEVNYEILSIEGKYLLQKLNDLSDLETIINATTSFLDKTLILDKEQKIKENNLNLLQKVSVKIFSTY